MIRSCVIGWPIAHSRSPLIHGYWLRQYGIAGSYEKRAVSPDDVSQFLRSLGEQGYAGCNVTVPHKEMAFLSATRKRDAARAVGAANTLWFEAGELTCDNTDGAGFMSHLAMSAPAFAARNCAAAAILGAGGSARALTHAFLEAGIGEVRIFNRTRDRADQVAGFFGRRVVAHDWRERVDRSRDVGLLVNATTLGMHGGGGPLDMDLEMMDASCVVADLVYVPLVTPLLAAARARGLVTVDGLGMLLHQAVPGFENWFAVRPRVTEELRSLIAADIEGR